MTYAANAPTLLLASRKCTECLTTPQRIVSGQRAAQIIHDCRQSGAYFQCHKGSIAGVNLHCRGVHDAAPSTAFALAKAFGIEVREIDPDQLNHKEPNQCQPTS